MASAPESDPAIRHSLPDGAFERLSAGPGDETAMASLAESHWSVIRALVATVASGLDGNGGDLGRAAADGWMLLSALEAEQPEAVREVLTYPYVQAWALQCLSPARSADFDLDRAHLAGMAAAAAMRAGIEIELTLPVRQGTIYLPTVGALTVDSGTGRTSTLRVSPSGLSSRHRVLRWQTVRRVTAGEFSVTVDDIDPFRDCQAWAPAGRLSTGEWRAWRLALVAAARQLAAELPAYANVIGKGLHSVVPMRPGAAGHSRSGTARHAFGAVALALPDDVGALSELLVHEMQHVKLTALCDLFDMFVRGDGSLFSVPWRTDRRPIEGLLHGTYAYLAIAELWRSRSRRTRDEEARRRFLRYRSWVEKGIETLLSAGTLMSAGDRFVHGMHSTVEAWTDDR